MQNKWKIFAAVWAFVFLDIFCARLAINVSYVRKREERIVKILISWRLKSVLRFHIYRFNVFPRLYSYEKVTIFFTKGMIQEIVWRKLKLKCLSSLINLETYIWGPKMHFKNVMKATRTYIQFVVRCSTTIHLAPVFLSPHILL